MESPEKAGLDGKNMWPSVALAAFRVQAGDNAASDKPPLEAAPTMATFATVEPEDAAERWEVLSFVDENLTGGGAPFPV